MTLEERQTQLSGQLTAQQAQLDALAAQGNPIRARMAIIQGQLDLLADLIAEQQAEPAPALVESGPDDVR